MKQFCRLSLFVCLATAGIILGQSISSSLNGVLVDPTGGAVPGASCRLINQGSGAVQVTSSGPDGRMVFPNVLPGTYTLDVQNTGFKTLQLKDVVVTAGEIRSIGNIALQLGEVRDSVSVIAEAAALQLSSAEKSGVVTGTQVNDLALKGRDFFALMQTIPGVVDTNSSREATTDSSNAGIFINGARDNQKNFSVDGVVDHDTHSNGSAPFIPNMDSIAEVRVLTSNYQAEYGRNGGGTITTITKSGTREFHGSGYDYYRHESLNANSFFNNRTGTAKMPYRYRISGYSIGGPAYIPGKLNRNKEKLFFFWSQEYTGIKQNYTPKFVNMPTELERSGDFSRSFDVNGALIPVKDPLTGQNFPGNVVPKSRINAMGLNILNFFPSPNYTDPDPNNRYRWNYRSVFSGGVPRRNDMLRLDANVSQTFRIFYRYAHDRDNLIVPWDSWMTGNINYLATPINQPRFGVGHLFQATKTFSPTLVNETVFGFTKVNRDFDLQDPQVLARSKMGNLPQWYQDGQYYSDVKQTDYIPNVTFGSKPANTVNASLQASLPNRYRNPVYTIGNNLSKVWRDHSFKVGIAIERTLAQGPYGGAVRGSFNFGTDANNPYDSGNGFANALLGNFTSYSEAQLRVESQQLFWNYEWYVQDNWKVSRRLTLDIGLRMYHMPPIRELNNMAATFDPSYFDPKRVPALYVPAIDPNGRRVAKDPTTGAFAVAPMIGQFVPGSGDPANGARQGGVNGYPSGLYTRPFLDFGPRFGFAYDLTGDGKTALRGGFGRFFDTGQNNPFANTLGNPPLSYTPTLYYGTLDTYAQSGGAIGPSSLNTLFGYHKLPDTMNYSLGIQRQVKGSVLDVSYVGAVSHHLYLRRNMNPIPIFGRFDPKNTDPTQPGKPLPDNFFRQYMGFGDLNVQEHAASSNYNSLQVSATRRFTRGLQFGLSYTWSKILGVVDSDTSNVSPYFAPRDRNYGPLSYDRTHTLVINYMYDLPKLGKRLGWRPAGWVLDNWELSGITSFISGSPFTPGFSTVDSTDLTGSTEGARIMVVGDPQLAKGDRTFFRNFNTDAFARTPARNFGNAGTNILRGPGINNWDLNLTKRVPLFSEARYIQFRTELFNAWNHTQFSGLYTTARFDAAGKQVDPNFGAFSAARSPRTVQLSLRVVF